MKKVFLKDMILGDLKDCFSSLGQKSRRYFFHHFLIFKQLKISMKDFKKITILLYFTTVREVVVNK